MDLREQLQATLGQSDLLGRELGGGGMSRAFLAEIRTTANLQHPHILPLFDSGAVRLVILRLAIRTMAESRDRTVCCTT